MATQTKSAAANQQPDTTEEAVVQLKEATTELYDAIGAIGNITAQNAQEQLKEGQHKAKALGQQAESALKEKPLLAIGVAFAAGWLVSRLGQR